MTVYSIKPELEPALIQFGHVLCRASIFFFKNLADIVDVTWLREGDEQYDYFLEVPGDRLDIVTERVAELQRRVQEQFNIEISVLAKATS